MREVGERRKDVILTEYYFFKFQIFYWLYYDMEEMERAVSFFDKGC